METQVCPRKPYPTDVSDDEWAFVAPYLTLMTRGRAAAAPRSARGLQRLALDRARRRARGACCRPTSRRGRRSTSRARRWLAAGVFETMVHDLRMLLREAEDRMPQPRAVIFDSRTRAIDAGERGPRRLRRAQAAQGAQDACGRRHARPSAGPARHPGQCPGPGAGRGVWPRRCRR